MAVYIDDSGSHGYDSEMIGIEDTAWSRNATDRAVWFSSTGTSTTGFTLPDTEWIIYEVYGMTGTGLTADYTTIATSTKLLGKKEYTTTIGTILDTLNAWRTALDVTNYDTYDIIATHYKGSDLADVYEADETVAFTTATTTDGDFTTHSSEWVINDVLLADEVSSVNDISHYVSFGQFPSIYVYSAGVYIEELYPDNVLSSTPLTILDSEGTDQGVTFASSSVYDSVYANGGTVSGDDSGVMFDAQMEGGWRSKTNADTITIHLPEGTWDIKAGGFETAYEGNSVEQAFSFDGVSKSCLIDPTPGETVEWLDIVVGSGGEDFAFITTINGTASRSYLSGMNLIKTA